MKWRRVTVALVILMGLAVPAMAGVGEPQLSVNGKAVVASAGFRAPHIHNNRLYVPAEEFAASIGAQYSEDPATGVVTISTGNGIPTLAQLQELNPKLTQYQQLSPYIPSMGIHKGVPGPHITLALSKEGTVNAFEAIVPSAAGWNPWFDQPEGHAEELPGLGSVYTQHIYVTDSAGLVENDGVPVILDGRYLSFGWEPKPHRHEGKVYIPARPAVELLGGSIHWDDATWMATATVPQGRLTWTQLKERNPKLSAYQALSEFVPNMGIHMGAMAPHLTVAVDSAGQVTAFELIVPADSSPWMPWFDQPEGEPMELPGLGKVWTQHIYLVDPNTIK